MGDSVFYNGKEYSEEEGTLYLMGVGLGRIEDIENLSEVTNLKKLYLEIIRFRRFQVLMTLKI